MPTIFLKCYEVHFLNHVVENTYVEHTKQCGRIIIRYYGNKYGVLHMYVSVIHTYGLCCAY